MTKEVFVPLEATEFQRRLIARLRDREWFFVKRDDVHILWKEFPDTQEADAEYSKCLIESVRP